MADYQETPAERLARVRKEGFRSGSSAAARSAAGSFLFGADEISAVVRAARKAADDMDRFGAGYVRMWVEDGVLKTERVDPRTIASKPAPEETANRG